MLWKGNMVGIPKRPCREATHIYAFFTQFERQREPKKQIVALNLNNFLFHWFAFSLSVHIHIVVIFGVVNLCDSVTNLNCSWKHWFYRGAPISLTHSPISKKKMFTRNKICALDSFALRVRIADNKSKMGEREKKAQRMKNRRKRAMWCWIADDW